MLALDFFGAAAAWWKKQAWMLALPWQMLRPVPRAPFHAARLPPGIAPGAPSLVGVSGGRDSVALLDWLRAQGCAPLIVCHLDHGLRAESREDAAFVRELAAAQGCAFESARANVALAARRKKISIETAAREARHAFFSRCARRHGTAQLFLAHHADDQAETFLFNLLRGAGPGGLGGMSAVSQLGPLTVVRPLLGVWREEVDAYAALHGLQWREDSSNATRDYTRNRLRHDGLPALSAAMGRDVRRALWRAAELLRAEDEALSAAAPSLDVEIAELETTALRALPLALQRRMLHAWLVARGIPSIGFEEVESVRALLENERVAKVNLPGGHHARRRAGRIFIEPGA